MNSLARKVNELEEQVIPEIPDHNVTFKVDTRDLPEPEKKLYDMALKLTNCKYAELTDSQLKVISRAHGFFKYRILQLFEKAFLDTDHNIFVAARLMWFIDESERCSNHERECEELAASLPESDDESDRQHDHLFEEIDKKYQMNEIPFYSEKSWQQYLNVYVGPGFDKTLEKTKV